MRSSYNVRYLEHTDGLIHAVWRDAHWVPGSGMTCCDYIVTTGTQAEENRYGAWRAEIVEAPTTCLECIANGVHA